MRHIPPEYQMGPCVQVPVLHARRNKTRQGAPIHPHRTDATSYCRQKHKRGSIAFQWSSQLCAFLNETLLSTLILREVHYPEKIVA